ncbi:MAG: hypothetical protein ABFD96_24920, partial [Armatimonadia bacterium]
MAAGKGIQIVVGTDYKDRDLKRAQRDLDRLKAQAAKTATPMQKLGTTIRSSLGPALAMAGAAAGALAVKFAVDGVRAAAAEETALAKLSTALGNVGQGFAETQVNNFIDDLQRATGVADDELRPAFQKLVTATRDAGKAQELLSLALDVSVGSGKSLESVSTALAKASLGQASALRRLGVPLSDAAVKSGDLQEITRELSASFGGQAANAAKTFEGQIKRLNVAFSEAQESFGKGFLDALGDTNGTTDGLMQTFESLEPILYDLGQQIGQLAVELAKLDQNTGLLRAGFKAVTDVTGPTTDAIFYFLRVVRDGEDPVEALKEQLFGLGEGYDAASIAAREAARGFSPARAAAIDYAEVIEEQVIAEAKRLYQQTMATNGAFQRQYFRLDEVAEGAGRYTDSMSLLRAEVRRATVRLGFLATAFDTANAAMDRRESMRNYQAALKEFIADPSAETRDAAVAAGMDMASGFKDPQKQAKITGQFVDEITAAAKRAGVNVPPDLVKIGDAARNQLDPIASLKRDLEQIDNDILVDIKVRTTYSGTPPPGGYPTGNGSTNGSAYGGYVGGHGGTRADDIPAMLSSGEFVIQAPAVSKFG